MWAIQWWFCILKPNWLGFYRSFLLTQTPLESCLLINVLRIVIRPSILMHCSANKILMDLNYFSCKLDQNREKLCSCQVETKLKYHCCGAVIIAEGTGSEVNPRVDLSLALVVLALPRVCLLPSYF